MDSKAVATNIETVCKWVRADLKNRRNLCKNTPDTIVFTINEIKPIAALYCKKFDLDVSHICTVLGGYRPRNNSRYRLKIAS